MVDAREPRSDEPRMDLPTGTVTFLRTDVEGSMALARAIGPRWDAVNATHLGLIRRAVDTHGGVCVRTEGDAFFGAFQEAGAAVRAAIAAQRAIATHAWPDDAPVRIRVGLHSGEAHLAGDDYGGFDVNRAARIAAAGHGGQIVLSEPTRLLAEAALTDGAAFRDLGRHVLRDVPSPERLFQVDIPGLRMDFPPLRTSRPVDGNLPERVTSFLGRDEELGELGTLLTAGRLVTLTGPGGIGKTSLAVERARSVAETIADGAWFVALDEIPDPSLVLSVVARTLGLFDGPDRPAADGLVRYLANRSILLVLDNFEHLLDAAGDVATILRVSAGTRILVTSRSPLRIAGEQEYPVRSLPIGGDACSALFRQRARAVRPGWDAGPDADVVVEICGLLDGLPLGVELAAARVSLLPVRAIRDRLAARQPLPGKGRRDAPDRQRTLEDAIVWSHDLLDAQAQRLLHVLGVFEGSFDVEQAANVADGGVFDGIATLVDQSLIAREGGDDVAGIRFRLLQTIRRFALDRLADDGDETEVHRRHAWAYLSLSEKAAPNLPGANQPALLDRLALDDANLRSATRWAIDAGETELALRLVASLWRYWQLDGHLMQGRALLDAAFAMPGANAPTAARLAAVTAAGGIAYWDGRPDEAMRFYAEERELARALGDPAAEVDAAFNMTWGRFISGDQEGVDAMIEDAISGYERLGDVRGSARSAWARGTARLQFGDLEAAEAIFQEILATFERIGDSWYHAITLGSLAWTNFRKGNMREAGRWLVRGFAETHALRDISSTVITLPETAIMAIKGGRMEDAAVLLGAAEALSVRYGVATPRGLEQLIALEDPRQQVREALDAEHLAAATERGSRMSLDEAAELIMRIGAEMEASGSRPQ